MAKEAELATMPLRVSRQGLSRQERHDLRNGLLFAAPAIVGFLLFVAYPILASVYYSFTSYSILQPGRWVGLENYRELLTDDPVFYTTLFNTAYMAVFTIPLSIIIAMGLAMLLNLKIRGLSIYRTIFYLPTIVPFVASSLLWLWIFNPQYGLINTALWYVGIQGPGWLGDPVWAKPALVIMLLWGVGNWMIIYLAGLQDVPQELYEAAEIDGARWWDKTRHLTIPFMSPYILYSLILMLIGIFQYFTQPQVMTQGGPVDSTRVYALYLYDNAFRFFRMGYASAMAWLLFLLVVVLTVIIFKSSARRIYYAGQ
jgi:multiple sugar transport system permease protein